MSRSEFSELLGDFHVHSTFSDDAVATLGENIAAAAARSLGELRLVDHVRRSTTWVPEFVAAVAAEAVPHGLLVHTGVEAKMLDSAGTLDIPADLVFGAGGIDTVLIADHQFPGTDGPWSPREARERLAAGLATGDAIDLLVGALVSAMALVPSAQLAHSFSILPKIGLSEDDLGDDHLAAWAAAASDSGTVIEINEKWACPRPRAIRAARVAGARLVASSDSHAAGDVGRYESVIALLREEGPS
jgi:putative hydrolase